MQLFLFLGALVLSASAVPQAPSYSYLEEEYGTIPFLITTDSYYPSLWQRVNGDPHGQAAQAEAPAVFGGETLSFDFPNQGGQYSVALWTHDTSGIKIVGLVTSLQLSAMLFGNNDFIVQFQSDHLIVGNATYNNIFNYSDTFSVLLDGTTGFKAFTLPESSNIQVEFLDYVFIVVGPGGIYPPDYDVTGNLQQALSVTMWDGDITQMRSLMGQIDGYWIFAPSDPSIKDYALAKVVINGVLGDPFLVRKSRHLGRYKDCWHYGTATPDHSAVIGNFSSFIV